MAELQNLVHGALDSIGALQTMAIALLAGLWMKDRSQLVMFTVGALGVDQVIRFIRAAFTKGAHVDALTATSWKSFLDLPMGQFLAAMLTFGLVIGITFSLKSMVRKA